jgi:hypothetical protein
MFSASHKALLVKQLINLLKMLNGYIFSSYTCEGKFKALYSKSTSKIKAAVVPKVYCTRCFTG